MTDEKKELKDIKKLSPQERIQKLKEIQEKNKEEIEKAQKMLDEAEGEAKIEEELKDIPIPQLMSEDIDALFSPEERELFKAKRFVSGKKKEDKETEENEKKIKKENPEDSQDNMLEEIAASSRGLNFSQEQEKQQVEYLQQLSRKPAEQLYNRAKELYSDFKDKGYLNPTQQKEFMQLEYANHKKLEDIESGKYTEISKRVANDMVLIERMKNKIQYRR